MVARGHAAGDGLLGAPVAVAGAVWFGYVRLQACKAAASPGEEVERPHATVELRQQSAFDRDTAPLPPLSRAAARPNSKAAEKAPPSLRLGRLSMPRLGGAERKPLQRKKSCDVPVMLHNIAVEELRLDAVQHGVLGRARSFLELSTVDKEAGGEELQGQSWQRGRS